MQQRINSSSTRSSQTSFRASIDFPPVLPNMFPVLFICLIATIELPYVLAHCPHMAAMAGLGKSSEENKEPSPPGKIPEGDKGWDYDLQAAPGILPKEQYIQTSFIYRNINGDDKQYTERVQTQVEELKERLGNEARLTLENENIECSSRESHYRCGDFPNSGSYHYLAVEDSSRGAAVYDISRRNNERSDGSIEMAILDALSRHSSIALTLFASEKADKQVGFVRALTSKELLEMQEPVHRNKSPKERIRLSPLELHLLEPSLLELRNTHGLADVFGHQLVTLKSQQEMDEQLKANKFMFVLFWSNTHSVSTHCFYQWASLSKVAAFDNTILAHVACHSSIEMCDGLRPEDLYTIVAYKDGKNIGSTLNIGDVDYYKTWITLMMNGPITELVDAESVKKAKKGEIPGLSLPEGTAVTIGLFPSREHSAYRHFLIVAESFAGRYAMAAHFKDNTFPTISTYRPHEKKKRIDYTAEFEPASITDFLLSSSLPSLIDISTGFTTDALFRQRRPILTLVSSSAHPSIQEAFVKLSSKAELSKSHIFTLLERTDENSKTVDEILNTLGGPLEIKIPTLLLFKKDQVFIRDLNEKDDEQSIENWLLETKRRQPDFILIAHEGHPLRALQLLHTNRVFGEQDVLILPDEGLFREHTAIPEHHQHLSGDAAAAGGCPFMRAGGQMPPIQEKTDSHDEL